MTISFIVYGKAEPQGSGKSIISKTTGKPMYKVDNPKLEGWRRDIGTVARCEMSGAGLGLIEGPISIEATFYLPRPKDLLRPKWVAVNLAHVKKPDLDKLTRALKDALRFTLYHDDSQVTDLHVRKRYAAAGEAPRVAVTVAMVGLAKPTLFGVEAVHGKAQAV